MPSHLAPRKGSQRTWRAFTLIELIVVILILGILAAIALVSYGHVTDRAQETAARAQLRSLSQAVLVTAVERQAGALDRDLVAQAIAETTGRAVDPGPIAAGEWTLLRAGQTPTQPGEISVGFRSSDTAPYTDAPGTQALLAIGTGGVTYTQAVHVAPFGLGQFNRADVAPASAPSVTGMWLWDNSLTLEQDNRGTGYLEATPEEIVTFARQQDLTTVHVAAPWVSDEGPIAVWMDETTTALDEAGFKVGVLGGDPYWLYDTSLAVQWATDAVSNRPVDHLQLSLEPWTTSAWSTDREDTITRYLTTIDAVKEALPSGVKLALDAPYWLATTPAPGGGTVFDALLERADEVAIVAFADHADGPDGILALSAPARAAAEGAGVPYWLGIETDAPAVTGGAQYTFADDGIGVLAAETDKVADALTEDSYYRGVCVQHYRTWRGLLGLD